MSEGQVDLKPRAKITCFTKDIYCVLPILNNSQIVAGLVNRKLTAFDSEKPAPLYDNNTNYACYFYSMLEMDDKLILGHSNPN